jgi:hypothetical protein
MTLIHLARFRSLTSIIQIHIYIQIYPRHRYGQGYGHKTRSLVNSNTHRHVNCEIFPASKDGRKIHLSMKSTGWMERTRKQIGNNPHQNQVRLLLVFSIYDWTQWSNPIELALAYAIVIYCGFEIFPVFVDFQNFSRVFWFKVDFPHFFVFPKLMTDPLHNRFL